MGKKRTKPARTSGRRIGDDDREEAVRLVARGEQPGNVAIRYDVSPPTVTRWVESEEGQQWYADERERVERLKAEAREAEERGAREAIVMIERATPAAVERLVELLASEDEKVVLGAIKEILGRGGVPVMSEQTVHGKLTVDTQTVIERLRGLIAAPADDGES